MTAHQAEPGNATDRRRVACVRGNGRREDIVNAAERLFSQDSYAAVSIRDIAAAAGVNSALIRYHFGTKEDLYRHLFERRYHLITNKRLQALEALRDGTKGPDVAAVVECWVRPLAELAADRKCRHFVDLLAREASDATRDRLGIIAEYLDPSAKICIEVLRQALPGMEETLLIHGYLWMIATVMSTVTAAGRAQRLGSKPLRRRDDLLKGMVMFVSSGLTSMAGASG
jgi:AcrR family transcriptional regulator